MKAFLESGDRTLVCTHATFRFAVDRFGIGAFDGRLIAVDEFHHVSASPDNRLGEQVRQFIDRDKSHLVAMTGSYFRGDAEAVLHPEDEARFDKVILERLLRRFLAPARLDLELKDRFDFAVEPQEWFLAPLPVIREVIQRLMDGSIENCRYDPESVQIVAP